MKNAKRVAELTVNQLRELRGGGWSINPFNWFSGELARTEELEKASGELNEDMRKKGYKPIEPRKAPKPTTAGSWRLDY